MKKIYCRPESRSWMLMPERIMTTDTNGHLTQSELESDASRRALQFEQEEEGLFSGKNIWDE